MTVVKSLFVGLTAAVVTLAVWEVGRMAVLVLMAQRHMQRPGISGAGGLGAVSIAVPDTLGVVLSAIAFVGGFLWIQRRAARRHA
jgi:hypothetical protein